MPSSNAGNPRGRIQNPAARAPSRPAGTGFGRGGSVRDRVRRRAEIQRASARVAAVGRIQGQ